MGTKVHGAKKPSPKPLPREPQFHYDGNTMDYETVKKYLQREYDKKTEAQTHADAAREAEQKKQAEKEAFPGENDYRGPNAVFDSKGNPLPAKLAEQITNDPSIKIELQDEE